MSLNLLTPLELEKTIALSPQIVAPDILFSEVFSLIRQESQDCLLGFTGGEEHRKDSLNYILVAEEDRLIGILTSKDLIRHIAKEDCTVRDGMTATPVTLAKSQIQDLVTILNLLFQNSVHHLPILNNTHEVMGVITPKTICQNLQLPSFLKMRKVAEKMQRRVITASPTASLSEIAQLMANHATSSVVIIQEQKPVGVITDSDILQWYGLEVNFTALQAQDGMYTPPCFISVNASLWDAHILLQQHGVSHLIVTGEDEEVQGIITPTEILQALQGMELYQMLEQLQQKVEQREAEKPVVFQPITREFLNRTQPIKVLLVNPAQVEAVLIRAMLQYHNDLDLRFQITHVSSLEAALQHLTEADFDVTLLDLSLPDSRGIETFQQIKQQFPTLPIVILSGVYSEPIPATLEYFQQGAQDFLSKDDYLKNPKFNQKMLVRSLYYAIERQRIEFSCQQHNLELKQSNERLNQEIQERQKVEESLQQLTLELEARVMQRTAQLAQTNGLLRKEITIRQQTEVALTQEQNFVSAILEATEALIIVVNAEGKIVRFNQACEKITGYSASEALGQIFWKMLIPSQVAEIFQSLFEQQTQVSFPCSYRSTLRTKEGDIRFIDWSNTALLQDDGTVSYIVSTGIDITEQQQSKAKQLQLLNLLEASLHEIYVFEADTFRFQYVNQGALQNLGYSWEQLQQMTPLNIKPELQKAEFEDLVAPLYNHEQEIVIFQTVHRRADGSRYPVEVHLQLKEQAGERLFVAMIMDISDRERVEHKLRNSLRELSDIKYALDRSAIVAITDSQGKITYVNEKFCEISQYSSEELLGQTHRIINSGYHPHSFFQDLWLTISQGRVWRGEIKNRAKDGSYYWVDTTIVPFLDENEKVWQYLAIRYNVTERKEVENALRESQQRYATLANISPVGIFWTNAQGECLYVNEQWQEITGLSAEESQGHNWSKTLYSKDRDRVSRQWTQSVEAESIFRSEYRFQRPDGKVTWVVGQAIAERDSQGQILGYVGTITDITQRKQAEEKLRKLNEELEVRVADRTTELSQVNDNLEQEILERKQVETALRLSEERFRQIAENIREVFWVSNPDFTEIIYISPAYSEIWQRSPDHWYKNPQSWLDFIHPDDRQEVQSAFRQFPENFDREYRIIRPNGSIRWIRDRAFPVRDETGTIYRVTGLAEDITHRKQAETELIKALAKEKELNQLKSRFVSVTSHEFRTPLAVISSSVSILQNFGHKLQLEQKHEHYQTIQTYIRHMTKLLDDILFINKAEVEKITFTPEVFDIISFCETLTQEIQLSASDCLLNFTSICSEDNSLVCMDKTLLRQILINLISNAIKYSLKSCSINIHLTLTAETATFAIEDSGIGIPTEDLPRLFDSFHRGNNVGTVQGTGLGLSIVKKGVDCHGGKVEVKSQLNQGTTFTVVLPRQVKVE